LIKVAKMTTIGGWAQLRQQIRTLESQTETIFHTYSQYTSTPNLPPKPSEDETRNEAEIEDLLQQRESLIAQLSRLLDSESALNSSILKQNNLSRHREILDEHRQELKRLKSSISDARNRQHLLTNVRSDIDAYRSSNPAEAEAEYMIQERGRLDNSHGVIDGVLSQAYAINENFGIQRETIASVNRRITMAAAQIPGVNGIIQRIGAKKRRDGIILGGFIAFCFLVFLYFS
jgi:Golgi SNAP receptor complex protein 1